MSKGLGAGTGLTEGLSGSWSGRRVEDKAENTSLAQFLDHQWDGQDGIYKLRSSFGKP